jgi:hypothetical protein
MSKARDLANAGTALGAVDATELGYLDGVTSAVQTQINAKEATLPSQTGNSGKYLTTDGSAKSWGTVSQYALPSQTGNSGKYLTTNGTAESWGTVNTPLTWTSKITSTGFGSFRGIASNGSTIYVAVGEAGTLYSSTDSGATWTSRTSGFGASDIYDVAYGNGLFVAVGLSGTLTTSADGITWTARTSNMSTNDILAVIYANSLWVAVGRGGGATNTGGLIYSTDGITWTRKSQSLTVGVNYNCVAWNGTNWLIGTSITTNNYLYATTPSGTWTVGLALGGNAINGIWSDGTTTIVSNGGGLYYYTATTLTSPTTYNGVPGGTFTPTTARIYSTKFYAYGCYLQSFTISANANPALQVPTVSPGTYTNGVALVARTGGIGVFAAGIVIGDAGGRIWTSF